MVPVECVQVRPADMLAEHHTIEDQIIESDLDGAQAGTWLRQGGDRATCQRFLGICNNGENPPLGHRGRPWRTGGTETRRRTLPPLLTQLIDRTTLTRYTSTHKGACRLGNGPQVRRITAIAAAGFSVTTQLPPERQVAWRSIGEELLQLLDTRGTGLVITVDGIHAADRGELARLAASVQHFIQDRLPIGLVFAGLPAAVSDLRGEGVATFLRRADKIDLHAAAVRGVETSFAATFATAGLNVTPGLVRQAAEATGGYPFLIQLVGYFLWREAENNAGTLAAAAVDRTTEAANRCNARTVIEAALFTASPKDMEFLHAMAEDDGPSTAGDIGPRLGAKTSLVANYRIRLPASGLIEPAGARQSRLRHPRSAPAPPVKTPVLNCQLTRERRMKMLRYHSADVRNVRPRHHGRLTVVNAPLAIAVEIPPALPQVRVTGH